MTGAVVVVVSLLMVEGCRSATGDPTPVSTVPEAIALQPSPAPPEWFEDRGPLDATLEAAIRREFATTLAVDDAAIIRLGAAPVLFRDTTLACPAPWEVTTGARIRGWIAYYEVGGLRYRAHVSETGRFRLCDLPDLDVIAELER